MKKETDLLRIALGKTDLREMKYLHQIDLLENKVEEVKPSIFQHPVAIVLYIAGAFAAGVMIAK